MLWVWVRRAAWLWVRNKRYRLSLAGHDARERDIETQVGYAGYAGGELRGKTAV
jgi:hypothetical protein